MRQRWRMPSDDGSQDSNRVIDADGYQKNIMKSVKKPDFLKPPVLINHNLNAKKNHGNLTTKQPEI